MNADASGDYAGTFGGRCTPVHPVKELSKYDEPRKGSVLQGLEGVVREGGCIAYVVF